MIRLRCWVGHGDLISESRHIWGLQFLRVQAGRSDQRGVLFGSTDCYSINWLWGRLTRKRQI